MASRSSVTFLMSWLPGWPPVNDLTTLRCNHCRKSFGVDVVTHWRSGTVGEGNEEDFAGSIVPNSSQRLAGIEMVVVRLGPWYRLRGIDLHKHDRVGYTIFDRCQLLSPSITGVDRAIARRSKDQGVSIGNFAERAVGFETVGHFRKQRKVGFAVPGFVEIESIIERLLFQKG